MPTIDVINVSTPNDHLGDKIRDAFIKCNNNFSALNLAIPTNLDILTQEVKATEVLAKGNPVYISGADGTNALATRASNNSEATSSKVLGLVQTGVATNGITNVVTDGVLGGLNTSSATAGDPVWLGSTGQLLYGIANKPVAPLHMVFIGVVIRANNSNGEIFVKVQNGFELEELHNVSITSVANNQFLGYDTATSLWKNKDLKTINSASLIGAGDLLVQPTLISGNNIKTINSTTLLGSGNISVQPTLISGVTIRTINSGSILSSGDLSLQPTLVSGTNIQTINGNSILGAGDLTISTLQNNGSENYIPVTDSTGNLQDSILYYDVAGGKAGINTTLPDCTFDVNGVGGKILSVKNSGANKNFEVSETVSVFNTNVGIWTDTPVSELDVNGIITAIGGDSNYWNDKQDALVSGTNIKTINGISLLGSGGITINGGIKGIHGINPIPTGAGYYYSQCLNASGFSVMNGVANRMYLAPFIPANTFTSISFAINVTTIVAGAVIRILLYSDNGGKPYNRIWESSNLDAGSLTGLKTALQSITFSAGTTYWIGVQSSSTAGTYALQTSQLTPLFNTNGSANVSAYYLTAAIGTAPATITSGLTNHSNTIPLAVINV